MRLRHIPGSEDKVENSIYCIHPVIENDKYQKIDIKNIFRNDNPLCLELGMGKGQFISTLATKNRNINYIGIERYSSVMLKAFESYENIYLDNIDDDNINLKFLCVDVRNLPSIFEEKSIDKIYLNFSDPWPKKRHSHRRLTSSTYLKIYNKLLKNNGYIEFKTDNVSLFDFSLDEMRAYGMEIIALTYDLHNDPFMNENNIMTEYEYKFSSKGNKICKLISRFK